MKGGIRPYLELVRVFLTPTAIADSYAGLFLSASLGEPSVRKGEVAIMVGGVSVLVYWLGMAANDLLDLQKDRVAAPHRPLPSTRVPVYGALLLCAFLAGAALLLSFLLNVEVVTIALLALVLLYNAGGKNLPVLGSLLMGLCRSVNFFLGACAALGAAPALRQPEILLGAGILGLYIAQVTAVSRLEDFQFSPRLLRTRALPLLLFPAGLLALSPARWLNGLNSALLAVLLVEAWLASVRSRGPLHQAAILVRKALPGLFLVDAGIVLALSPPGLSTWPAFLTLYALFAVAWTWKRSWIRAGATGS